MRKGGVGVAKRDVSVVFSASNKMSKDLQQMRGDVGWLSEEIERYQKIEREAFEKKATVKLDIMDAKMSIKELEKAIKSGSAEAREAYISQTEALEGLSAEYKHLTMVQKEAEQAQKDLLRSGSRASNANAERSSLGGAMSALSQAGLGKMLGESVGNFLGQEFTSAFGESVGSVVGNIGTSAAQGAAMGSIVGPVGTAIGAGIGALTGGIKSYTDYKQETDSLFRQEVQSLYSNSISDMENRVSNSSGYAAERENYKRNYASMTDDESGARLYQDIMHYGDVTPYDTSAMLGEGMRMLSYGVDQGMIVEMMQMIGDIGMGDENKFSGLSYAIAQSMNSGTLNGQDRNQMVGWGFDPLEFVAKNEGISRAEAKEMMSDGKITSDMLVDALRLATSEGERYHDAANSMSDTYSGLSGQLESAQKNIDIAMGEGYNEKRKEGMMLEIEAYNGELGEKMKDAYAMIGAYEAEMENQYQQSIITALEDAANTIEEKGLEGIEAEKVMWEAKSKAEIAYKNSEEYMMKLEAEKGLVEQIQGALTESGDYVRFGKEMSNQFSQGFQEGFMVNMKNAMSETLSDIKQNGLLEGINGIYAKTYKGTPGGSHASGLRSVPYDGYIAELHEGEQVLTRVQAQGRGTQSIVIPKLADQIIVREDADIDRISAAIVQKIAAAREGFVG